MVRCAAAGVSVFFTGSAGTGKSMVLSEIRRASPAASTAFTGTTGVAAVNIGGTTLHAFAGVTTSNLEALLGGRMTLAQFVSSVRGRRDAVQRWQATRTLVVDELSMLDAGTFDALEALARAIRGDPRPFGGITLVLSGDFFQLPPVSKGGGGGKGGGSGSVSSASESDGGGGRQFGGVGRFCFRARSWASCVAKSIELTTVFRQSDPLFVDLLNELRWGRCSDAAVEMLRTRWKAPVVVGGKLGVVPTKL